MKIYGFQKLTLLDYPDHLAALVFTGGCNLRCPWCQNSSLICVGGQGGDFWQQPLAEADILRELARRAAVLEGVVITGGEPTLQPDLREFILHVRDLGYKVKLDTNGTRPDIFIPLVEDHLVDYIAMDVKADREKYREVCGVKDLSLTSLEESIQYLVGKCSTDSSGFHCEFRTTVIPQYHDAADMRAIAEWIAGAENYYLQAFRDSELVPEHRFTEPDAAYMRQMLAAVREILPHAQLRGVE